MISGYARNETLVKALNNEDYHSMFPNFFYSLKVKFDAEVHEQRLRRPAAKILASVFKFADACHPVLQEILTFLSDKDLGSILFSTEK